MDTAARPAAHSPIAPWRVQVFQRSALITKEQVQQGFPISFRSQRTSPGSIDTDIMGGMLSDGRKDELVKDLVTNRIGTPHDIAAAIGFLIGEESGYITGQTLTVDGGLYMH